MTKPSSSQSPGQTVKAFWTPVQRWIPSEWLADEIALARMEEFVGDRFFAADELRRHLHDGELQAGAILEPYQAPEQRLLLKTTFWQTLSPHPRASPALVYVHRTLEGKTLLSFGYWRFFIRRDGLDRLYPVGEAVIDIKKRAELSPAVQELRAEIERVCGPEYKDMKPGEVERRVGAARGPRSEIPKRDQFLRALGRKLP